MILKKVVRKILRITESNLKIISAKIRGSHSQYGEDFILDKIMNFPNYGTYIDIGANDPVKFNNTYRFYKRGWSGVNVEPNPVLYQKIASNRGRDTNLNVGVSDKESIIDFYSVIPDTLSTFSKEIAEQAVGHGFKIKSIDKVKTISLKTIFEQFLNGKKIDFLSIDVEGYESDVLRSNDWDLHRPKFLLIEINRNYETIKEFLTNVKYMEVYNNKTNGIYQDSSIKLS